MRQIHKAYNLKLAANTKSIKPEIKLEDGDVIGGFINIEKEASLPVGFTNVGITASGRDIVDPIDVKSWKQRAGGSYDNSYKPFYIDEKQVKVTIESSIAPTTDVNLQLVLIHKQHC